MKPFRIAQINLNDDQEVDAVVAVIDKPYAEKVAALIGAELTVVRTERGGTEIWALLAAGQILRGHHAVRSILHSDPNYVPDMSSSLGLVIYGLMED